MSFRHCNVLFASASLIVALTIACVDGIAPTHLLVVNGLDKGGLVTFPIAKPVHTSRTWEQRKASFGERMHEAFGTPLDRAHEFAGWILEAADRQKLAPELFASLVFTESSFRKRVRSPSGAIGPAQIKPWYWRTAVGRTCATLSIYCGAQVLTHLQSSAAACRLDPGVSRIVRHRSKFRPAGDAKSSSRAPLPPVPGQSEFAI